LQAQLQLLQLDRLKLEDSHVRQLSEWLPTQAKSLQSLSLQQNCIAYKGLETLLAPFYQAGSSCQLKSLDLAFNNIGEVGAQKSICRRLASQTSLNLIGQK
jgi:Ran GTPase-activating protein (RanGAP) involved in mRNA processing and transport